MFFSFPENARWNADRQAVEFGVEIGKYSGVVPGWECRDQRAGPALDVQSRGSPGFPQTAGAVSGCRGSRIALARV